MREVQKRNIALCIVFTIITCGIYGWVWLFNLAEDVNSVTRRPDAASGGMVVLFSILTCNIYNWYWLYKSGDLLDQLRVEQQNRSSGYLGVLYLVLAILGFSIISLALMQSEVNEYATE